MLRCLGSGEGVSSSHDPATVADVLDAEGRALLGLTLAADPARRPTAREWVTYSSSVS